MGVYTFLLVSKQQDECNGRRGVTPEYPNGSYYLSTNYFQLFHAVLLGCLIQV